LQLNFQQAWINIGTMSIESSAQDLAEWFTWATAKLTNQPLPRSSADTHLAVPRLIQAANIMFTAWEYAVEMHFGGWSGMFAWMAHRSGDPTGYQTVEFALYAAVGCFIRIQTLSQRMLPAQPQLPG
jgi:hypothetical protein